MKNFWEGRAKVKINDNWGYINKNGKLIIPAIYTTASKFNEDCEAEVTLNGKSRYINVFGEWLRDK